MKLAAVVVLYNPEELGIENIKNNIETYRKYCEHIYLVDNSECPHENFIFNATYIFNGNKGGLGGGQNRGVEKAAEDGYQWVMTMDQDSAFKSYSSFLSYKNEAEKIAGLNGDAVSFGPLIQNINKKEYVFKKIRRNVLSPLKKKILGVHYVSAAPRTEEKCRVIASGNIISVEAWRKVCGFDESLFISEVDYDLCYKFVRSGFKIFRLNSHVLIQRAGEKVRFHILPKFLNQYTDTRFYYAVRNAFIMKKRYPEYKKFYARYLKLLFWDYCINSAHFAKYIGIWKNAKKAALEI